MKFFTYVIAFLALIAVTLSFDLEKPKTKRPAKKSSKRVAKKNHKAAKKTSKGAKKAAKKHKKKSFF